VARNPQQSDFIRDRLESGKKCENASYNWVGGVRVYDSVDRREEISDDYDGGSGPERIVSRQWKMTRSWAVKIKAEFQSLEFAY